MELSGFWSNQWICGSQRHRENSGLKGHCAKTWPTANEFCHLTYPYDMDLRKVSHPSFRVVKGKHLAFPTLVYCKS